MDARLRSEVLAAKRLIDEGLLDSASLKLLRNAIVQSVYPSVRGADSPFQGKSTPNKQRIRIFGFQCRHSATSCSHVAGCTCSNDADPDDEVHSDAMSELNRM